MKKLLSLFSKKKEKASFQLSRVSTFNFGGLLATQSAGEAGCNIGT
jgi:hypothetical protein